MFYSNTGQASPHEIERTPLEIAQYRQNLVSHGVRNLVVFESHVDQKVAEAVKNHPTIETSTPVIVAGELAVTSQDGFDQEALDQVRAEANRVAISSEELGTPFADSHEGSLL
ncbi:MAG: hypothetical protein AAB423_02415 [Patescibacteria group bacterium]